jgi:integrase
MPPSAKRSLHTTIPLHPAILTEGFLGYVKSVPADGALFPNLPPDAFGKRSGVATKRISKWLRAVGVTDSRKDFHSWRHTFITECRNAHIDEEISPEGRGASAAARLRDPRDDRTAQRA